MEHVSWSKVSAAAFPEAYVARILVNEFARSRRRMWWHERPTARLPEAAVPDGADGVDGADAVARGSRDWARASARWWSCGTTCT